MLGQDSASACVGAAVDLRLSLSPERREELRRFVNERMGDKRIAQLMGISRESVSYHRRITLKVSRDRTFMQRPIPADFAAEAPKLLVTEACERWNASDPVVRRWHREAGTTSRARFQPKVAPSSRQPAKSSAYTTPAVPSVPGRMADQAAHHLRRHFPQVCRLRTLRGSGPDGVWVVGRMEVNEDRLIKLAEKHGFNSMVAFG